MEHLHHEHQAPLEDMASKKTIAGHSMNQMGHNPAMGHAGHDHMAMIADFKKRFYIVLVLTVPIVVLSPMIQHFIGVN